MSDPLLISWGDAYLVQSDLATIEPSQWVGDNLLSFHSEWLRTTSTIDAGVGMWPPSLVELLVTLDPSSALGILPKPRQRFLLLPVSDRYAQNQAQGSHWSLLLFDTATARTIHFDSLSPTNVVAAQRVATAIFGLVRANTRAELPPQPLERVNALQRQSNGCDCGVYVLALSQSLQRVLEANMANLHRDASPNILDQVVDEVAGHWHPHRIHRYRQAYNQWLARWAAAADAKAWTTPAQIRRSVGEVEV
ncbi:hypothetical protein ACQY0O_008426 [Thecaphora frezii]